MTSFFKCVAVLLMAMVLLPLYGTVTAMAIGSTVRIEQKNGSIIIGTVVQKTENRAWIKTRYGVLPWR